MFCPHFRPLARRVDDLDAHGRPRRAKRLGVEPGDGLDEDDPSWTILLRGVEDVDGHSGENPRRWSVLGESGLRWMAKRGSPLGAVVFCCCCWR